MNVDLQNRRRLLAGMFLALPLGALGCSYNPEAPKAATGSSGGAPPTPPEGTGKPQGRGGAGKGASGAPAPIGPE